jgi:diguanylate cyclase (GGDEF)-like protein
VQKVLAIDDSKPIHALLKARLADEPIELHNAMDGESGLRMAAELCPDLVLLDVDMPQPDGFEVCRRLKGQATTAGIPIIFLTGASSTEEKIKGLDLGAVDYITKPFDPAELRARVRASLRNKFVVDLLAKRAMIDGLTGLWNRAYFDQALLAQLSLTRRSKVPLSCIMLDIDHFKSVNDRYGHPMGDQVLRGVGQLLMESCRVEDIVCRYGGEEFAVIVPNSTAPKAAELAERLRVALAAQSHSHRGEPIRVTASQGVADSAHAEPSMLVEQADKALYAAKESGRNCVRIAEPPLRVAV